MSIELTNTNASRIASALLSERRNAGSPAMGMVLTLVVVTDEGDHYDAMKAARAVSREHPARILGVIRRSARGAPNLDAEIKIGDGGSGAGILTTASGLAFTGDASGNAIALRTNDGATLWHSGSGRMGNGPITYELDGRQYIVVGGGSSLYAFALPQPAGTRGSRVAPR